MPVLDLMGGAMRHGMRAYYLPLTAGCALAVSAFMPWTMMGELRLGGVPNFAGVGVLGLGALTMTLAALSVITRKNSRHPLLLVGLVAFAIVLLAERLMERAATDRAWAQLQARAIVEGGSVANVPEPTMAFGAYLGLFAAAVITLFGLTIVFRRAPRPYAEPEDDDA